MRPVFLTAVLVHVTSQNLDKLEREHPHRYGKFMLHFEAAAAILIESDVIPPGVAEALTQKLGNP